MDIKVRAYEVKLSNGELHTVHEPRMTDLGVFVRALPALTSLGKALESVKQSEAGIIGVPVDVTDAMLEGIHPLFAIMSDISVDEFKALPLWDGMAIITALNQFVPNEPAAASSFPASASSTPTPQG